MKLCKDCNKEIKNNNKVKIRCLSCHTIFRKRNLNTKYYCKDCGKETEKKGRSMRCRSCARAIQKIRPSQGFQKGHGLIGNSTGSKGKTWKLSDDVKKRMSIAQKLKYQNNPELKLHLKGKGLVHERGDKHHNWKGGITNEKKIIRQRIEMKLWRKACLERDNFTCQKTGKRGGNLEVHHINNFADFPELRTSIENGVTLSKSAHLEFHKLYGFKNNTLVQLQEFLNN